MAKLRAAGYDSVFRLAVATPDELIVTMNWSWDTAAEHLRSAHDLLRKSGVLSDQFITAKALQERRKEVEKYSSTGSKELDKLLQGGIETHAVTEVYGSFASGKSQLSYTLAVLAQTEDGFGGNTLYMDTENTFRASRLVEIATARGVDVDKVLQGTIQTRVYNAAHFELLIRELGTYMEQYHARLVILDSIIAPQSRAPWRWATRPPFLAPWPSAISSKSVRSMSHLPSYQCLVSVQRSTLC